MATARRATRSSADPAGEIVVPASFQVVHALLEHDLVDELRPSTSPA
jgi:hypothetical protein